MAVNHSKILLTLFLGLMALCNILSATPTSEHAQVISQNSDTDELSLPPTTHLKAGRFLTSDSLVRPPPMTCDKYPKICSLIGSAGPDCCKKQCVDVMTDKFNCGKCGNRCKYSEICCQGKCVNPSRDPKNCGKCNNKCEKGSKCVFGLCSYA